MPGLSCSGLLAATQTKTLVRAFLTRSEAAPVRHLAGEVDADPAAAPPNPFWAIQYYVFVPLPAPFPYVT
jgi:hypothetical protein